MPEKKAAAEERDEYFSAEGQSRNKTQSYPTELSENCMKATVCWSERAEKEGHLEELEGDQSPGPQVSTRCRKGRSKKMSGEQ